MWLSMACTLPSTTPSEISSPTSSAPPSSTSPPLTPPGPAAPVMLEWSAQGRWLRVDDVAIATDGSACVVGTTGTTDTTSEYTPELPTFVARITSDGQLDLGFGGGWWVLDGSGPAEAVAAGPDGGCWVMAAGNLDGLPDTFGPATFALVTADGAIAVEAEHPEGPVHDLVAAADGSLWATGAGRVYRFDADGAPDPDFGVDGVADLPFTCAGSTFCDWGAVAPTADGGALVVGFHPAVVSRVRADGALDPAYDGASSGALRATAAVSPADGALTLVGSTYDDALERSVVATEAFDPTGTPAPAVTAPLDPWGFDLAGAALDAAGELWVAGRADGADGGGPALVHLTASADGWTADEPTVVGSTHGGATMSAVAARPDGAVVAAGYRDGVAIVYTSPP